MKQTRDSGGNTSFHGTTFTATPAQLRKILGEPADENNSGEDKVNMEWVLETDGGDVFTVYDWKMGHSLAEQEKVKWHIGGKNERVTGEALSEIKEALYFEK
jgi:L-ascorbate metabolism protein UlaG (beta-lactamase superfamily)